MTATATRRPYRMVVVHRVLEAAKDNSDDMVIAACRRLVWANTLGWKAHADRRDWDLVRTFDAR